MLLTLKFVYTFNLILEIEISCKGLFEKLKRDKHMLKSIE